MGLFGPKKTKEEPLNLGTNSIKEDPFGMNLGLGNETGLELDSLRNKETDSFGNPTPKLRSQEFYPREDTQNMSKQNNIGKDIEIIIAKLDTIRAEIASLNHKVENLERSQKEKKYPWQQ